MEASSARWLRTTWPAGRRTMVQEWRAALRRWLHDDARGRAPRARPCAAAIFRGGGRRRRPPLRRRSGDVVTAGLITSRVWFGPVPGSP
ncbi:hypothetical protein F511_46783 [Dorcoceras hygrometricum]|uniref:Uncharacterized protein n=1 Tax=Dorcoceras hygrometricum TaxID=472368 RepID=A0A2Z6ZTP9_9LAMI|nr:hypothetical protein F511_46783 [Dorcoceras hygrometricum]